MNILNPKNPKGTKPDHLNYMAGGSYDISDPVMRLRIAASSCFFGEPQYYQATAPGPSRLTHEQTLRLRESMLALDPPEWRGMSPAKAIESAVDAALAHDPERTPEVAAGLRQVDHIRTTPQVILVRAAHHPRVRGTGLVKKFATSIVDRLDEVVSGLAYHVYAYGKDKPIPNSLKKAWKARLERASEYELAKYKMGERQVKLVDVVNLVHPKSEAVGKLVRGELKNEDTWEAMISSKGSTKENWEAAIEKMGHMALLRNLRNFKDKGVEPSKYLPKLIATAATGKQLPFRYYSAYQQLTGANPQVLDAVEQCLENSLGNLPHFEGRTMALCDNSGSARRATTSSMGTMHVATIANLTGVIAGKVSDEGYVGVFGDRLTELPVRKKSSVFDSLKEVEAEGLKVGQNTENGIWLFWDKAIREKQHWDNVFVMSDMQAGHGGLYGLRPSDYRDYLWGTQHIDVTKLVNKYRATVNPKVKVFLIQVAGYQDTIMPEFYNRTYILGGWGEGVLRFAAAMAGVGQ